MRHKNSFRKLSRNTEHRRSLLRNLATSLVLNGKIETTLPKAKELKRIADKLVTLGKKNSLAARRQAESYLFGVNKGHNGNSKRLTAVHKLFSEIAPRYSERNGGYTRVVRTGVRPGDNAQKAIIAFVEKEIAVNQKKKERRIRKSAENPSPQVDSATQVQESVTE